MVDIVAMPTRIGQRKYLVLAQEDLTNQVEDWALRREEVFCRYGCVGQVIADRGELDSDKARGELDNGLQYGSQREDRTRA